ncbi:unnamed protein product [Thelazia callipaeda]|uniref:Isochorismatase domain-containing protein n=1 Tax=Thelazia callipaeda TaxID=103827 RepID=A0A0N5CWC0_THECL|nr:unnamed protein product [Thelazia callipaeda]
MMMQHATALATNMQAEDCLNLEAKVRKAKAEGQTVTITDGCVFFDYQLIARLPPGVQFNT